MIVAENKSGFPENRIIQMARRENNKKRSFLIVNPSQAKHIPAKPSETMALFKRLSDELKKYISADENVLFIGFAETATAIGAGVASFFKNSDYMHTTRESIENAEMIVEFKELHSHAVQQTLQSSEWNRIINGKKHIIFMEDEISTGTTIMNFVNALCENKKVPEDVEFSVCSVINGMSRERTAELAEKGVVFRYIMKISMDGHKDMQIDTPPVMLDLNKNSDRISKHISINGMVNARTGIKTESYIKAVNSLAEKIISSAEISDNMKIAVIGTEEFMYPAIYTAYQIEKKFKSVSVVTHSTTRSPVEPHNEKNYPLKSRAVLESFYEKNRVTYLYNTYYDYDLVILVTDSGREDAETEDIFMSSFMNCRNFITVRWVK